MLLTAEGYSQAPGILNYQGVARNSVGNVLVNQNITLRLTIRTIQQPVQRYIRKQQLLLTRLACSTYR
ncbi:MAG: hypothetical protein IPI78_14955 [Chitinophagaceae bacterium]|nr:hypothetical protein [Chitinophagaceae bacterium]